MAQDRRGGTLADAVARPRTRQNLRRVRWAAEPRPRRRSADDDQRRCHRSRRHGHRLSRQGGRPRGPRRTPLTRGTSGPSQRPATGSDSGWCTPRRPGSRVLPRRRVSITPPLRLRRHQHARVASGLRAGRPGLGPRATRPRAVRLGPGLGQATQPGPASHPPGDGGMPRRRTGDRRPATRPLERGRGARSLPPARGMAQRRRRRFCCKHSHRRRRTNRRHPLPAQTPRAVLHARGYRPCQAPQRSARGRHAPGRESHQVQHSAHPRRDPQFGRVRVQSGADRPKTRHPRRSSTRRLVLFRHKAISHHRTCGHPVHPHLLRQRAVRRSPGGGHGPPRRSRRSG